MQLPLTVEEWTSIHFYTCDHHSRYHLSSGSSSSSSLISLVTCGRESFNGLESFDQWNHSETKEREEEEIRQWCCTLRFRVSCVRLQRVKETVRGRCNHEWLVEFIQETREVYYSRIKGASELISSLSFFSFLFSFSLPTHVSLGPENRIEGRPSLSLSLFLASPVIAVTTSVLFCSVLFLSVTGNHTHKFKWLSQAKEKRRVKDTYTNIQSFLCSQSDFSSLGSSLFFLDTREWTKRNLA